MSIDCLKAIFFVLKPLFCLLKSCFILNLKLWITKTDFSLELILEIVRLSPKFDTQIKVNL